MMEKLDKDEVFRDYNYSYTNFLDIIETLRIDK